jgi:hypothetical protein
MATALDRAQEHLFQLQVLESFIARREIEGGTAEDDEIIGAVGDELLSHQSPDGSWGGSLAVTAEALLLLDDLHVPSRFATPVARAEQWLRKRRRATGRYTEGCDPDRHKAALCEHFAGGFFSPGPPSKDFSNTRLASGLVFPTDPDARLGLSSLALHAVRRWSRCTTDDLSHLEVLARIANSALRTQGSAWRMPTLIMVLSALTSAPRRPEFIIVLHGALTRLAGMQRADGSWPDADAFLVAEVFLLAVQRGYGSPVFDAAIARTAEMLALVQQEDGGWGAAVEPPRLLSGWRTLRYAAQMVKA